MCNECLRIMPADLSVSSDHRPILDLTLPKIIPAKPIQGTRHCDLSEKDRRSKR